MTNLSLYNAAIPSLLTDYSLTLSSSSPSSCTTGGSGANEAKVFDHKADNAIVGTVTGLTRGIFTVDFSPNGQQVAIAGGDATIRILSIVPK